VDQLSRSKGLSAGRITEVREALAGAESASGASRRTSLTALATALDGEARGSGDTAKVQMLARAVRDLSTAAP
jgi:hypothetical protein